MADNKIEIGLEVTGGAAKKIDDVAKSVASLSDTIEKRMAASEKAFDKAFSVFTGGAVLASGIYTVKKALDALFEADNIRAVNTQFEALATNAGIAGDALKQGLEGAADGLIDDTDLIKIANRAIIEMGGSAARLPQVLELARKASLAFGGDVAQNFETINSAIAGGQTKALKQFGIIVDSEKAYRDLASSLGVASNELSLAGRQQALLNAVLEVGGTRFKDVKLTSETTTNSYQRLKVVLGQLAETASLAFDAVAGSATQGLLSRVGQMLGHLNDQITAGLNPGTETAAARMRFLKEELADLAGATGPRAESQIKKIREEITLLEESERKLSTTSREKTENTKRETDSTQLLIDKEKQLQEARRAKGEEGKGIALGAIKADENPQEKFDRERDLLKISLEQQLITQQEHDLALAELADAREQKLIENLQARNELLKGQNDAAAMEEIARNDEVINAKIAGLERGSTVQLALQEKQRKAEADLNKRKLQATADIFGNMTQLAQGAGKDAFEIAKVTGVAEATIRGVLAVQAALDDAPFPFNIVLAGTIGALAAANVAKIASAQPPSFATGLDSVPPGFENDSFPAFLQSKEAVLNRGDNEKLARIANQSDASPGLLAEILTELRKGQTIVIDGREVFMAVRDQSLSGRVVA